MRVLRNSIELNKMINIKGISREVKKGGMVNVPEFIWEQIGCRKGSYVDINFQDGKVVITKKAKSKKWSGKSAKKKTFSTEKGGNQESNGSAEQER